jgi:molybdopterin molybdotransferase
MTSEQSHSSNAHSHITGLILAGGQGRRMGRVDKGLQLLHGRRMVDHVYERLSPQVGGIVISANQNQDAYRSFGVRVVSDMVTADPGDDRGAGPLAGLHAGLSVSRRPLLMSVPCDTPFIPADLVSRLHAQLEQAGAQIAVVRTGDQSHPVFALMRRSVLGHLSEFLKAGGRKIDHWYASLKLVEVDFPDASAFANINTREELQQWEQQAAANSPAIKASSNPLPSSLPVRDAQALIRKQVPLPRARQTVSLRESLGRVLAEDVISPINVPAHNNSAMDGWAVRSVDLRAQDTPLLEIGSALAGVPFQGRVDAGQCVRITTGAVMPEGCDSVVVQEVVRQEAGPQVTEPQALGQQHQPASTRIWVPAGQSPGQNRRLAGEDLTAGKPALRAGERMGPAAIGLLASIGLTHVPVYPRLRVAILSTGDELCPPGEALRPGQIYDSNRHTLWGLLQQLGCEVIDLGMVRDDPLLLEAALREAAASADAVITSGGVSVGEADFTKPMMRKLGEVEFWTIAMRPGRPMAFGWIAARDKRDHRAMLFGLPGNPVAVMVTFHHFVRAALLRMMGCRDSDEVAGNDAANAPAGDVPLLRARSTVAIRKRPGRTEYQRGVLSRCQHDGRDEPQVRLTGSQGSGILRSMVEADCFIVLDHAQGDVAPGDWVDVMLLAGLQ